MARRELGGRVALVTGASSGVGWLSAVRLGEAGMRLCVTARRGEALDRLAGELGERGIPCLPVPGDVSVGDDVARVVRTCIGHYGQLDLLVNNAAVQSYAYFEQYDWEEIVRTFDVNCFGYLRFARAVLPHFRERGEGHIINVLSMLSVGAAPLLSVYTATKHALLGWAESLRLELHESGVEVSNVLLPSLSTPMFDHAPTHLGLAPRPVPPTYDTEVGARAVLRCAERPHPRYVPVFLQGTVPLLVSRWAPSLGDFLLARWGVRMQLRRERVQRPLGNLYEPVPGGVGPYGSVAATAPWKRHAAAAGVLAGGALVVGVWGYGVAGAVRAARELRRRLGFGASRRSWIERWGLRMSGRRRSERSCGCGRLRPASRRSGARRGRRTSSAWPRAPSPRKCAPGASGSGCRARR